MLPTIVAVSLVLGIALWAARPRYVRVGRLMTPPELRFYRQARKDLGSDLSLHPKVRVADIITVGGWQRTRPWFRAHAALAQKHVDFVVCDRMSESILLAIEVDDRSHARADRIKRDRLLDRAFDKAGVPLLRVAANRRWQAGEINELVRGLAGVTANAEVSGNGGRRHERG